VRLCDAHLYANLLGRDEPEIETALGLAAALLGAPSRTEPQTAAGAPRLPGDVRLYPRVCPHGCYAPRDRFSLAEKTSIREFPRKVRPRVATEMSTSMSTTVVLLVWCNGSSCRHREASIAPVSRPFTG
jgi:hypothetical protein